MAKEYTATTIDRLYKNGSLYNALQPYVLEVTRICKSS